MKVKNCTDLEQSRKLSKILKLESADMFYATETSTLIAEPPYEVEGYKPCIPFIPCWSLAALLSVLEHPRCFQGDKPAYWFCGCFDKDKLYHEVEADNPVDACVEMILKLYELKRL